MYDYEYITYLAARRADAIERRKRRLSALRHGIRRAMYRLSLTVTMLRRHVPPKRTEWNRKTTASKT
jgi:hypothetical protein